jgi:hypothetical protein
MDIKNLKPFQELSEFDQSVIKLLNLAIVYLENIDEIKGLGVKIQRYYLSTKETINLRFNEVIYLKDPNEHLDFGDFLFSPQAYKLKENSLNIHSTSEIFKQIDSFNDSYKSKMDKVVATYPEDKHLHHAGHEEFFLTKNNYLLEAEKFLKQVCPQLEMELEKIALNQKLSTETKHDKNNTKLKAKI